MIRTVEVGESIDLLLGVDGWTVTDDDGVSDPVSALMVTPDGQAVPLVGLRGPERLTVIAGSVTIVGMVDGLQVIAGGVDAEVRGPIRFVSR